MRIGIDAHALGARAGGNETYMRHLLEVLSDHARGPEYVAYLHRGERPPENLPGIQFQPVLPRNAYLRVPIALPRLASADRLDVLHVQYTAPLRCSCPYVVSLHDIVAFRFPESLPFLDRHRLRWLTRRTVRNAARIFVLTRAVQREIAALFGVPEERFDLVQPVADPHFRPIVESEELSRVRNKYRLPEHFLLYVGQLQPRKNLLRLAEAFAGLVRQGYEHRLVIAGKRAWLYREMLEGIDALNLGPRILFTGYLDYADLPALYSASDLFVYPSLYEGFGIPVLEALGCGAPVVTSDDPAIVEVAGGAALHTDCADSHALQSALQTVLDDGELRARLRVAGPERAAVYTAEASARAALAGYQAAAEARGR